MGRLKDEYWFTDTNMTKLHIELLTKCLEHDLEWLSDLITRACPAAGESAS
jgi:DNA-binding protein YbaB